jgi:type VI secretion system protein ImpG
MDRLVFYATGRDDVATALCELCMGHALGTLVAAPPSPGTAGAAGRVWQTTALQEAPVLPVGLADSQALLPVELRSFHGYRLLQEYFSFPERYRFFELTGLRPGLAGVPGSVVELVVLFDRGNASLERIVDGSNLALFCTPAINLFPKRLDRVTVSESLHEYHALPDRTRPMDFEVHSLTSVVGFGTGAQSEQAFHPFYAARSGHTADHLAYYTVRREPRLLSASQKRTGPRSSYVGSEMFVSLVDPGQAPFSGDLRQLAVHAMCTNRDLALHMPHGIKDERNGLYRDLSLDISAPVADVRVVTGPSRPYGPLADGAVAWRAINHLSLNYYSLADSTPEQGAAALRELLHLYADLPATGMGKQIEGIRSVGIKPVVRRLPGAGPITFGRGLEITMTVDPLAFEGGSAYVLGAVLSEYFARHVSINSFTETALVAEGRGELHRWVARWGARPTL